MNILYTIGITIFIVLVVVKVWKLILISYQLSILKGRKISNMKKLDVYDRIQTDLYDYYNKTEVHKDIKYFNKQLRKLVVDSQHIFTKIGEEYVYTDEFKQIRITIDSSIVDK